MTRLERRRRIRCRLRCEIVEPRRHRAEAAVLSLSEGGLSVEAALRVEQGDPIRLRIRPHPGAPAVTVEGIVWTDHPSRRAFAGAGLRVLGCLVSDPSPAFLELLARVAARDPAPEVRLPAARARVADALPAEEADLPRSRDPLPPPKPDPEESLPGFRVRLKQVGGPRTRIVTVRARSLAEAKERARRELAASPDPGGGAWEVLEAVRVGGASNGNGA